MQPKSSFQFEVTLDYQIIVLLHPALLFEQLFSLFFIIIIYLDIYMPSGNLRRILGAYVIVVAYVITAVPK